MTRSPLSTTGTLSACVLGLSGNEDLAIADP